MARAFMTWGHVGEGAYIIERRWGRAKGVQAWATMEAAGIGAIPVGREIALAAARIKASHGMAYADTFAAALALSNSAILVIGDSEFFSV